MGLRYPVVWQRVCCSARGRLLIFLDLFWKNPHTQTYAHTHVHTHTHTHTHAHAHTQTHTHTHTHTHTRTHTHTHTHTHAHTNTHTHTIHVTNRVNGSLLEGATYRRHRQLHICNVMVMMSRTESHTESMGACPRELRTGGYTYTISWINMSRTESHTELTKACHDRISTHYIYNIMDKTAHGGDHT